MILPFLGKTLSCIAATGTVGAFVAMPKIRSALSSVEKDILDLLDDLGEEERKVFEELVDVTNTTTQDKKEEKVKSDIEKISQWLKKNGGCRVNFVISEANKTYFRVPQSKETTDITLPIFTPHSKMGGKSKIERFADDLESKNNRSSEDAKKYNKYLDGFKERCEKNKNKFIRLHWRGQIFEQTGQESTVHSKGLEGLTNLWVDEKVSRS